MAGLFDHPTIPPLRNLLEQVRAGSLLIPEFQRPFVWRDEQRLNLLDSVARGLPIGAMLVWRTRKHELHTYPALGPFPLPKPTSEQPRTYLIDGHQRLTTLYAALTRYDAQPYDLDADVVWPILVDLRETGRAFVLPRRSHAPEDPALVPAWVLLNNKEVFERQQVLWRRGLTAEAGRLEELANAFKDYPVPLIPMISEDIRVVTNAFARVNTGGTRMTEAHLAAALAYGRLPLRSRLEAFEDRFRELGWPVIDQGAVLDLLKLRFDLDIYRSDINILLGRIAPAGTSISEGTRTLDQVLFECDASLQLAIEALRSIPILGSGALPYRYQLLLLAEALRQTLGAGATYVPQALVAEAERWVWHSAYTEAFTGATGSQLRAALIALRDGLRVGQVHLVSSPVRNVRPQRWGAVRTLALTLANVAEAAQFDDGRAARHLAESGGAVVLKVLPGLRSDSMASWIVATPDELRHLRSWLSSGMAPWETPGCAAQLDAAAIAALAAGEPDRFIELQEARLARVEARRLVQLGLDMEP